MSAIATQITSRMIVYSIVNSGVDQRKHQSSASLAFVRGIHRWPVNSPHKWPVTRKMFPFHDVIMIPMGISIVRIVKIEYACLQADVMVTYTDLNKTADILRTTISNAFSWIEFHHNSTLVRVMSNRQQAIPMRDNLSNALYYFLNIIYI